MGSNLEATLFFDSEWPLTLGFSGQHDYTRIAENGVEMLAGVTYHILLHRTPQRAADDFRVGSTAPHQSTLAARIS